MQALLCNNHWSSRTSEAIIIIACFAYDCPIDSENSQWIYLDSSSSAIKRDSSIAFSGSATDSLKVVSP